MNGILEKTDAWIGNVKQKRNVGGQRTVWHFFEQPGLQAPNHSLLLETNGLPSFCLGVMERWVNVMLPLASWKMFVKVACLESWLFGKRMQKFCRFCCGELIESLGNADSRHAGTMLEGWRRICTEIRDLCGLLDSCQTSSTVPCCRFFELIQMFWAHNPPPKKGESWECSNNMLASPHHDKNTAKKICLN